MLINNGRFMDRNPDIVSAGKLFGGDEHAKDCMKSPECKQAPNPVEKFRCTTQPGAGKTRIFYGRYSDPDVASSLTHGVNTKPSYMASQLVNPDRRSYFKYRLDSKREESVYASKKDAPLGKCHDQKAGLPKGVGLYDNSYGMPTLHNHEAGELVNPLKSRRQVQEETLQGSDLYKKSHQQYDVGETCDRRYNWSRISPSSQFGIETPHDNRGLNTKKSLTWMTGKGANLTSKRLDHFRERNMSQVGKVHDPIKETLQIDNSHTHGILVEPDEYGAGHLIHMKCVDTVDSQGGNSDNYCTSYSQLNGIVRKNETKDDKSCGIPTVRSDLPAPRIRRMGDSANYGDESDAYGLMNPSIYSNRGVYEEDFFKNRDQTDIKRIFDSMGVEMSHETFLELWDLASKRSSNGLVSVESFRNCLDGKIEEEYEKDNKYDSSGKVTLVC